MLPFEKVTTRFFEDLFRIQTDVLWAGSELVGGILTAPALLGMAPQGSGHKRVLTIPGFNGPEFSLGPLNVFLTQAGYPAESWGMGVNTWQQGPDFYDLLNKTLGERLDYLAQESGEPVSLIGQSLGGLYAREVAKNHPDLVDRVITLGTPVYLKSHRIREMNHLVSSFFHFFEGANKRHKLRRQMREHIIAPPVPLIAIYSKYDGVLSWQSTRIPDHEVTSSNTSPRENIEVLASHCGMGINPLVLLAICDRLGQSKEDWQTFEATKYFPHLGPWATSIWYPPQNSDSTQTTKSLPSYLTLVKG